MAHFAKVELDNVISNVVVVPDNQEHRGEAYLNEIGLKGRWVQASYNANIRGMFPGAGDVYNEELDRFEPIKEYDSHIWDEESYDWVPPIPLPTEEGQYAWDEDSVGWIKLDEEIITQEEPEQLES